MCFGNLTINELLIFAMGDARYEQDPLFTELVERLAGKRT
jgi:hypothetical protein